MSAKDVKVHDWIPPLDLGGTDGSPTYCTEDGKEYFVLSVGGPEDEYTRQPTPEQAWALYVYEFYKRRGDSKDVIWRWRPELIETKGSRSNPKYGIYSRLVFA